MGARWVQRVGNSLGVTICSVPPPAGNCEFVCTAYDWVELGPRPPRAGFWARAHFDQTPK
eukprot:8333859-Alexandrium_andersonii.AAC.1